MFSYHACVTGLLLTVLLTPVAASAADLDVFVLYFDSRVHRANTSGSLLTPATQNTNQYVEPGLWVYLYEQDGSCQDFRAGCGEGNDDLLAIAESGGTGYINFGTLPTNDPGGTGYPDIYVMTLYINDDHKVEVFDGTTDRPVALSDTLDEVSSNTIIDWNITCPDEADGFCNSIGQVEADYKDEEQWANLLQTVTDVRDRFTTSSLERNGHTNGIDAHVGCLPGCSVLCASSGGGVSCGYDSFAMGGNAGQSNHAIAHEYGHLMMRRAIDYSGQLGFCGGGWTFTTSEDESCVVSEGWADFTAAATYFDNSAVDPWIGSTSRNLEGDYGANRCVSQSSSPERRPGNAARFFWDLFDDTTEDDTWGAYSDNTTWYHGSGLCDVWDDFDPGTSDRDANEPDGGADVDGRNAFDFYYNESSETGDAWTELYINCLFAQDLY